MPPPHFIVKTLNVNCGRTSPRRSIGWRSALWKGPPRIELMMGLLCAFLMRGGAGHLTKKIAALSTEKGRWRSSPSTSRRGPSNTATRINLRNVKYEVGDVGDYPHPSRMGEGVTFDVVVLHACLQHVFSPSRVLQAASKLVRGGGAVIVAQAQGRKHADELSVKDPVLQPRGLPSSPEDVEELIPEQCPLELASFKDEVPYVVELKCTKKFEEAIGFKDMMADEDPRGSFLRKKTGKEPTDWREKLKDNAGGVVLNDGAPPAEEVSRSAASIAPRRRVGGVEPK